MIYKECFTSSVSLGSNINCVFFLLCLEILELPNGCGSQTTIPFNSCPVVVFVVTTDCWLTFCGRSFVRSAGEAASLVPSPLFFAGVENEGLVYTVHAGVYCYFNRNSVKPFISEQIRVLFTSPSQSGQWCLLLALCLRSCLFLNAYPMLSKCCV